MSSTLFTNSFVIRVSNVLGWNGFFCCCVEQVLSSKAIQDYIKVIWEMPIIKVSWKGT